jgi:hypothetical protein
MNSPHKLVMDAIKGALSHTGTPTSYGWNARFPAIALAYAAPVEDIVLDFTSNSRNVFYGQLAGFEDLDMTQVDQYQACAIYTTMAANARMEKPRNFSGVVLGHVDWCLSYRDKRGTATGIEANDTESPLNAIDEAMCQIFLVDLGVNIALPSGVRYFRDFASQRTPLILNDDGFSQIVQYELPFEVHI